MFTKPPVVDKALRKRVVVNFLDSGSFIGHLAEYDSETYVFEQCETVPASGETAQRIPGRQYVDRINCWLQELPT